MATKTNRYTRLFKANAVRLASESNKPIAEIARELSVPYGTLYNWMWKAGVVGNRAEKRPTMEQSMAEAEVHRLRRELQDAKMENDFLKKWAAFSTNKTSN